MWWYGYTPWMMVWPLVMLGLVVIAFAAMMRMMRGETMPPWRQRDDALQILKRRYARGEINRQEYEDGKRLLSQP